MCSPITKDHRSAFISVLDTWELPAPRFQSSKPEATSLSYLFILVLMPATHVHRLSHTHTHTCTGCLTNTRAQAVTHTCTGWHTHVHRLSQNKIQTKLGPEVSHTHTHTCTGCHGTKSKTPLAYMFKHQCHHDLMSAFSAVSPLLAAVPLSPHPGGLLFLCPQRPDPTAGRPVSLISEACPDCPPPHHPNQYP